MTSPNPHSQQAGRISGRFVGFIQRLRFAKGSIIFFVILTIFAAAALASLLSSSSSNLGTVSRYYLAYYEGMIPILAVVAGSLAALKMLVQAIGYFLGTNSEKRDVKEALICLLVLPVIALIMAGVAILVLRIPMYAGDLVRLLILSVLLGEDVQPPHLPSLPHWWPEIF